MTPLITAERRALLLANGRAFELDPDFDPPPVVKLFTPDAAATWLLASVDPDETDVAYGLCDPGLGSPELGTVLISEIESVRGRLGLRAERDLNFVSTKPISAYAAAASSAGRIVTL